jgi:hypothetical protein
MPPAPLIYMGLASENGKNGGKNYHHGPNPSGARGDFCAEALYVYPFTFFRLNYSRNIEICPCIVQLPNVHLL